MQRSFKQRLEALERLDAQAVAIRAHVLYVFLQIRPDDYMALFDGDDDAAKDRVWATYGLDQIDANERVVIDGGTWPWPRPDDKPSIPWVSLTIALTDLGEGYGSRIDVWPLYAGAPVPGDWHWHVAITGEVEQMRRARRVAIGES